MIDKPKVFFDGACPICSFEIDRYQKKESSCSLEFVDIASSSFSAPSEGLESDKVNQIMHLKTESGEILLGVDAFQYIWKKMPEYHWLYRLSLNPVIKFFLKCGYEVFRRLRPHLPKLKKNNQA